MSQKNELKTSFASRLVCKMLEGPASAGPESGRYPPFPKKQIPEHDLPIPWITHEPLLSAKELPRWWFTGHRFFPPQWWISTGLSSPYRHLTWRMWVMPQIPPYKRLIFGALYLVSEIIPVWLAYTKPFMGHFNITTIKTPTAPGSSHQHKEIKC